MNLLQNPNKRRWYIVATIFVAIICNYLDRQLLSILKPEILTHFGIEDLQYAWIVNVFLICYAIMYPISGILVDRFGSKKVMLGGIVAWSLACIGGGLSTNVVEFTICRGILGLAEPTIFAGNLGESIGQVFQNIGKRFTFGGEAPKDQRIYYFNTKELTGNKYGTPSPVPFRVVDQRAGIDIDIAIRCFGEYSYRITNPLLFYTNVCGNVTEAYTRDTIDGQLKSELLTALQPAFARISDMGIRYSSLPGHTREIAEALNEELSAQWRDRRGLEIVAFGVSSVKANEEDEQMIKEMQREAAYMDPTRAAAMLSRSQGEAMKAAASNTATGPAMAFMGMGMAGQMGGINAQNLYAMGQQQAAQQAAQQPVAPQQPAPQPAAPAADGWTCACGKTGNTGKFCGNCGQPKPADESWTCTCGAVNKGKFCAECGRPRPAAVKRFKCDKCGWEPEDPTNPPKFCPECGDPFNDGDSVS